MGLREPVLAEALDLAEAAGRELGVVAAPDHAADHLLAEQVQGAAFPEGGHRVTQGVGFVGTEPGCRDRDAHRLLLEQWNAQGVFQHSLQFVRRAVIRAGFGVGHRFQAVASPQIGVHHVTLDGTGTHDRDLDHQVVEAARPEARQHVHLGAAFDLEHADGVRTAEHVVHRWIVAGHVLEFQVDAPVALQQRECLADAGQHAEGQHVDLHEPEGFQVVLVPFDKRAVRHGRLADRHHLAQGGAAQHEPADMLGEVAGEPDQLGGQGKGHAQARMGGVETRLTDTLFRESPLLPEGIGQGRRRVLGQAHGLADVPGGAAGAVGDHGRGQGRPVPAVPPVDVLDDLLALFVLEIDVDVGRLPAFGGDEALEQQVDLGRVDGGDAEAVADR